MDFKDGMWKKAILQPNLCEALNRLTSFVSLEVTIRILPWFAYFIYHF